MSDGDRAVSLPSGMHDSGMNQDKEALKKWVLFNIFNPLYHP